MRINLSPYESDDTVTAAVSRSTINVNGQSFDFSNLEPGSIILSKDVGSDLFAGPVVCHEDGEIEVTLRLPYPAGASENMRFPQPLTVAKGSVPFPKNIPQEPSEDD